MMLLKLLIFAVFLYYLFRIFRSFFRYLLFNKIEDHFSGNVSRENGPSEGQMNIKHSKDSSKKENDINAETIDFEEVD